MALSTSESQEFRIHSAWDWVAWVVLALALVIIASIMIPRFVHGQDAHPDPALDAKPVQPADEPTPAPRSSSQQIFDQLWGLMVAVIMTGIAAGFAWAKRKVAEKLDTVITGVAISGSPTAKSSIKALAEARGIETGMAKLVAATETKNADVIKKRTTMSFDPNRIIGPEEGTP